MYYDFDEDYSGYVRQTSRAAFEYVQESGILSKKLKLVYNALYEHGPCTVNELWKHLPYYSSTVQNNIPSTVTNLKKSKAVVEVGKKKCSITGRTVHVYDVSSNYPIKPEESENWKKKAMKLRAVLLWVCEQNPHLKKAIFKKYREIETNDGTSATDL